MQELIITAVYLLFLVFWRFNLNILRWELLLFLAGGILGVYFLDLAEMIIKQEKSPFKNVLFQAILAPFTLFMVTSSGSLFGSGLTLSIFLSLLFGQWREFKKTGSLDSWFWIIKTKFSAPNQRYYLLVVSGIFIFLSLLF